MGCGLSAYQLERQQVPKKILEAARQVLDQADTVRLATIKAAEKAEEALRLEASGEAAELVKVATLEAAKLVVAAEQLALEAFEAAAVRSLARKVAMQKLDTEAATALEIVSLASINAAKLVTVAEETALELSKSLDKSRK